MARSRRLSRRGAGLCGASGTGKSVLTRTILGLVRKQRGTIQVFGQDLDELSARERVAMEQRWGVLFSKARSFPRSR